MEPIIIAGCILLIFSLCLLWLATRHELNVVSQYVSDVREEAATMKETVDKLRFERKEILNGHSDLLGQNAALKASLMEMRRNKAGILGALEAMVQEHFLGGEQEKRPKPAEGPTPEIAERVFLPQSVEPVN